MLNDEWRVTGELWQMACGMWNMTIYIHKMSDTYDIHKTYDIWYTSHRHMILLLNIQSKAVKKNDEKIISCPICWNWKLLFLFHFSNKWIFNLEFFGDFQFHVYHLNFCKCFTFLWDLLLFFWDSRINLIFSYNIFGIILSTSQRYYHCDTRYF